jgi:hypothetical protein
MTIERRVFPLEMREAVNGSDGRQRWATAVTYGTVDSYGTMWIPEVFTEALAERMPTVLYGHDWWTLNHVLGQGIDSREMDYGVDVLIEYADPEVIEAARIAMALTSGDRPVIRDVSVGFERREWRGGKELEPDELALGAMEAMVKAGMDELSLVIRGAVPGASLRSRSRRGVVDLDAVMEIARRKTAGELSDAEAHAAIDLLALDADDGGQGGDESGSTTTEAVDHSAVDAELDAALDRLS